MIAWGGLGDILLSTPAFKALKQKHPGCRIIVYCPTKGHREIFRNNPDIDAIRSTSFFANPVAFTMYYFKWAKFHTFLYGHLSPSLYYRKSAKEIIADMFDVTLEDKNIRVFLTPEEERKAREYMSGFKNPVVLHITSRCSKNQEWPFNNWDKLIRSMPEYTFIQLGLKDELKVKQAVDLRGTTFREALAFIKHARGFVGVNSSFSHATNAFGIPGVVLFGPSQPEVWGHPNNINLYKPVRCAPCLDILLDSDCPYDKRCMHNITVEEVRAALLRQLEKDHIPA